MKKSFVFAALALATAASFAGVTGSVSYDYDNANSGQGAWSSQHEVLTSVAVGTKLGTFDAGVLGRQLVTRVRDNNVGFEVGYSTSVQLGKVAVKGRAAYGQVNSVDLKTAEFSGNSSYYSLAAEASVPLDPLVSAFVGYRFRDGLNAQTPAVANRYTAGVDFVVAKGTTVRLGAAHTRIGGLIENGVTTAVSYKF